MARKDHHGVTEQSKASSHRREDARVLLEEERWRGAMYISGYVVECVLKAQLMRKFRCATLELLEAELVDRGMLPDDRTVYTHQLIALLELTGDAARLRQDMELWRLFNEVNRWVPAWRYTADPADEEEAASFLEAVDQVTTWVRNNV